MFAMFVSEEVDIEISESDGAPASFIWRGRTYGVDRVLKMWHDWGFPLGLPPKRQAWRMRRHRNHYLVSSGNETFELYRDRAKNDCWILLEVSGKGDESERSSMFETGS
jgi:hypothetical protein